MSIFKSGKFHYCFFQVHEEKHKGDFDPEKRRIGRKGNTAKSLEGRYKRAEALETRLSMKPRIYADSPSSIDNHGKK